MIAHNLLSVPQLTHAGAQACFFNSSCQLLNGSEKLIAVTHLKDSLYRLPAIITAKEQAYISTSNLSISDPDPSASANIACSITASTLLDVWHSRLGHISMDSILKMMRSGMVKGMNVIGRKTIEGLTYCSECKSSSHHCNPIPSETHTRSDKPLGHVFSDVCEVQTIMCKGFKYFITFVDDYSCYLTVYLMKAKSDAIAKFKEYLAKAE